VYSIVDGVHRRRFIIIEVSKGFIVIVRCIGVFGAAQALEETGCVSCLHVYPEGRHTRARRHAELVKTAGVRGAEG
jgi:hypothetical protein